MTSYVDKALFLHSPEEENITEEVVANSLGCHIKPIELSEFLNTPELYLEEFNHVVVSGPLDAIKSVLSIAITHKFSIGIIPLAEQTDLKKCYGLPSKLKPALELALQTDPQVTDIILCNKKILLFKGTIGRLPMIDFSSNVNFWQAIVQTWYKIKGLRLLPFQFETDNKKKIKTAACGSIILQHHEHRLASKLISNNSSLTDGLITTVITAPKSIFDYFRFILQTINRQGQQKKIPTSLGYVKTPQIQIETTPPLEVSIDGEKATQTPLHCEVIPRAIHINIGQGIRETSNQPASPREKIEVKNLPDGKEINKASNKQIPFFSYASEDRFRDLFISLREDAKVQPTYLVLMLLSTLLATIGLYQSSSAVVIGAMLLAPLMAPIVSLAMGLLRYDTKLTKTSIITICVGIIIALTAAMLISLLFPHKPITLEMQARINPSLLDLAVAIVAGCAGAYTKSHREILQSLAGVSIAVALVPPLAVAGIGLGMGDFIFFSQAFLLFLTNLIGITLVATITFRVLGYSPAVQNKYGIALVTLILVGISIPLYLSYHTIVKKTKLEKSWQQERFLINGKYLIVQKAELVHQKGNNLIFVKVLVREPLTRKDLNQIRKRIQSNFGNSEDIRIQAIYIP